MKDGSIVFLVDSEPPGSPGYSPPGDMYLEAADVYYEPFTLGKTVITHPVTDRWGTWVSVLVPVVDPVTEKIIAVFGIDFPADKWYADIYNEMIPDTLIVISVFLLLLALFHTLAQHAALKKLSKRLAFDEALFRNAFDKAPIGFAIVNDKHFMFQTEFGRLGVNPKFEQILGRNSRELEGLTWTDITHPEDLQEDLAQFARFQAGEIDGYTMEKRFIKPDGSFVWTRMTVSPFPGEYGETTLHLCLLEDISVRKEAEDSLRESERSKSVLLSHLPGMAYRCDYDRDWTMRFVSEGCYELTGYRPESLIGNRVLSYNEVIAPEYREALWRAWEQILWERTHLNYEYQIITADGSRKWVLEKARGIYAEQGEVVALEGIILDISSQKAFEEKLKYDGDHDRWTGLYNRSELESLLMSDAQAKSNEKRALVSINLTDIQSLASTYGFHYIRDLIKKNSQHAGKPLQRRVLFI
jgi:PAS domain S-box-containing protein